jgi:hypothetical protein
LCGDVVAVIERLRQRMEQIIDAGTVAGLFGF